MKQNAILTTCECCLWSYGEPANGQVQCRKNPPTMVLVGMAQDIAGRKVPISIPVINMTWADYNCSAFEPDASKAKPLLSSVAN